MLKNTRDYFVSIFFLFFFLDIHLKLDYPKSNRLNNSTDLINPNGTLSLKESSFDFRLLRSLAFYMRKFVKIYSTSEASHFIRREIDRVNCSVYF